MQIKSMTIENLEDLIFASTCINEHLESALFRGSHTLWMPSRVHSDCSDAEVVRREMSWHNWRRPPSYTRLPKGCDILRSVCLSVCLSVCSFILQDNFLVIPIELHLACTYHFFEFSFFNPFCSLFT